MRKMMTKEVSFTTLKIAKMEVKDGLPTIVQLPDEVVLGEIKPEKAQKLVNKKYKTNVTIYETIGETKVYEMPVADFIKVARVKGEDEPENTEELENEDIDTEETDAELTPEEEKELSRFKTF